MTTPLNPPDISVLIATYNRAEILRQTLEALCRVERDTLSVSFVVVDNNSADETEAVVQSFRDRLPVQYLFQPKQGKSPALNMALESVDLGEIIVFTDDDVFPEPDWLKEIARSARDCPEWSVFGGRITLVWPEQAGDDSPIGRNKLIRTAMLGEHDHGTTPSAYSPVAFPFGANFWIRRAVVEEGLRFREELGPEGGAPPGEDIMFIKDASERGYAPYYWPGASVGHLVEAASLNMKQVEARFRRYGRSFVVLKGLVGASLYARRPGWWRFRRGLAIFRLYLKELRARVPVGSVDQRLERRLDALVWREYHRECLQVARNRNRGEA